MSERKDEQIVCFESICQGLTMFGVRYLVSQLFRHGWQL